MQHQATRINKLRNIYESTIRPFEQTFSLCNFSYVSKKQRAESTRCRCNQFKCRRTGFNTPDHIKAAAVKAVEENYSRYSPVPGYPALREAISAKLKNENGLDYAPAQILCSNGAKQSVCNAIMALVNAGDEVIIPAPYWVSYPQMVKLAEGEPVIVEAGIEQDFKITPEQLEAAITPKTRALILCSPAILRVRYIPKKSWPVWLASSHNMSA